MAIDGISGTSSVANVAANSGTTSTTSTASKDQTTLADNYEMFLNLLTVQLQNQNPLEPMDADQFADQLTKYSSLEQQIKTNDHLEQMLQTMSAANMGAIVSYIGKEIEASGTKTVFNGSSATWAYSVDQAATAKVTILNSAGAAVYTEQVQLSSGTGSYSWDGRTSTGGTAPEGSYTLSIEATDSTGSAVSVTTNIRGTVDEVDLSGGEAVLKIGDISVPVGSVTAIRDSSLF